MELPPGRSIPLLVLVLALGGAGAVLGLVEGSGRAPAPCPEPGMRGAELVCDGTADPPGARVFLAGGRLDVNRATAGDLEALPGVGPKTARAIVDDRGALGPFATLDELTRVKGIGPKTLERLRPWLRVE